MLNTHSLADFLNANPDILSKLAWYGLWLWLAYAFYRRLCRIPDWIDKRLVRDYYVIVMQEVPDGDFKNWEWGEDLIIVDSFRDYGAARSKFHAHEHEYADLDRIIISELHVVDARNRQEAESFVRERRGSYGDIRILARTAPGIVSKQRQQIRDRNNLNCA